MEPMDLMHLTLALLALLLTPGPTNTLILLAGNEGGWRRVLALLPVEVTAYLSVIAPLALLADVLAQEIAGLRPVVAILAGLWVFYLAIRLWRPARAAEMAGNVTAARVAVTTLLNPKGLIMGLVLLPAAGATGAAFGLLAGCILLVALLWGGAGVVMRGATPFTPGLPLIRRAAAVWLAGLSIVLLAGGFGAA